MLQINKSYISRGLIIRKKLYLFKAHVGYHSARTIEQSVVTGENKVIDSAQINYG